jgi:hypothetical protein
MDFMSLFHVLTNAAQRYDLERQDSDKHKARRIYMVDHETTHQVETPNEANQTGLDTDFEVYQMKSSNPNLPRDKFKPKAPNNKFNDNRVFLPTPLYQSIKKSIVVLLTLLTSDVVTTPSTPMHPHVVST